MCWISLAPKRSKRPSPRPPCVEEITRLHHSPSNSPHLTQLNVKVASTSSTSQHLHHHLHPHIEHRHPHLHPHHIHPLHLHPLHNPFHHHNHHLTHLHGPGHKLRAPSPPPSRGRPPSPYPSPAPAPAPTPPSPKEPIYRTQVVEPAAIRAHTLTALQNLRADRPRARLRRVAGYEMLGRDAPWNWDCVSSDTGGTGSAGAGGSSVVAGGKWVRRRRVSGGGGKRFPPFGGAERWM